MRAEDHGASAVVVAPVELDVASAADFAERLAAAFETGSDVVVADLARTTFCDSSGLKVLVHAASRAHAAGRPFEIHEPPRMLRRMAAILGATCLLGLPADEHAPGLPARPSTAGESPGVE